MKRAGVCDESHIKALGNLDRDTPADGLAKIVDHLSDSGGGRVDPVDRAEMFACGVVVDVNGELFLKVGDAGAKSVGALDNKNCIVFFIDSLNASDVFDAGKFLIRTGDLVTGNDFCIFAKRPDQPIKPER